MTNDFAPGTVSTGGAGTGSIGGNEGNPYRSGNGGGNQIRSQLLVLASELTAAGMAPGNITSLAFTTTAGSTGTMINFEIGMANTSATALSTTFETTSLTSVYTLASFTPVSAGLNVHTFSTPFFWNGTSNLLINVCQTNSVLGTATIVTETVGFNANTHRSGTTTGCTDATGSSTSTSRPIMTFGAMTGGQGPGTYTWTWNPGSLSGNSVTATPSSIGVNTYTVTATDPASGCTSTATVDVTVNPVPVAPTATNSTQCGVGVPMASAVGSGGIMRWYTVSTGGSPIAGESGTSLVTYTVSSTTTFYVSEFDGTCEGPRAEVIAEVTNPDAISLAASSPTCLGSAITLTATQTGSTNTYVLTYSASPSTGSGISGSETGSPVSVTPTAEGTYTYTVTATDATAGCVTASSVVVTVTGLPNITSATASPSTVCSGSDVVLTALTGLPAGSSFHEGFETFPASFATSGTGVTWALNGTYFQEGAASAKNTYVPSADGSLSMTTDVNLSTLSSPTFEFWHICASENGFDYGRIEYSLNGGATWLNFPLAAYLGAGTLSPDMVAAGAIGWETSSYADWSAQFTGSASTYPAGPATSFWKHETISLASVSSATTFRVRFRFTSDTSVEYAGWAIDNVRINYATTSGAGSYAWQWGPGSLSSGNVVTVNPTSNTTYTVTATDPASGCTSTATVDVTVNPLPSAPTATDNNQCGVGIPNCSVSGSGGLFSWYLTPTGGTPISGETGATLTAYTISSTTTFYVAEFDGTCESLRTPVVQTVSSPDAVTASSSVSSACGNSSFDLTATQTGSTNTYTYVWTAFPVSGSGIPTSMSGSPVTVTPTAGGTFTYTVTATDADDNCVTTSSVVVTTTAPPVINTASATPSTICLGSSSTLFATSDLIGPNTLPSGYCTVTNAGSSCVTSVQINTLNSTPPACVSPFYHVNAPVGTETTTLATGASYTMTLATGGTSIISVWIDYNRDGVYDASEWVQPWTSAASGTVTINVPVTASPGLTGMRIRSRLNGNTNGSGDACLAMGSGSTEDYAITLITPNPGVTFVWNPGSLSGGTQVVTPSSTGTFTYTVTATDASTGCTSTASVTVDVIATPATPTVSASPSTICGSGPVTLTVTNATSGASYQWQESASGLIDTWTDISGANSALYTTGSISATTYYRAYVTCSGSADTSASALVTVLSPSITSVTNATRCGLGSVTMSVTGVGSFDWYANSSGGTPLATNTATYTTNVTSTTTFWVIAYDGTCLDPAGRQFVTATVNPAPTVTITNSAPSNTICSGTTLTLTATSSNDPNYTYGWSTDGVTVIFTGAAYTVTPSATTTYFVGAIDNTTGTFATCQEVASITINVNETPATPVISATATSVCNVGECVDLSVVGATVSAPATVTIGTGTVQNTTSSQPAPLGQFWTAHHEQYLILASELSAQGLVAGPISKLGFDVVSLGALNGVMNFQVSMAATSATSMSAAFVSSGMTQVYTDPATYFSATGWNTFNFTTPFSWNGTSNVVVDVSLVNCATCPTTACTDFADNDVVNQSTTAFVSTAETHADGNCSVVTFAPTSTINTFSQRPNMQLYGITGSPITYTWNPGSVTGPTLHACPTATTTYTVVASSSTGCSSSASVTIDYTPLTAPTIVPSATTICGGSNVTLDGGAGYTSYSWSDGVSVVGTSQVLSVNPTATTTYTLTVANGTCTATASQTINVFTVIPASLSTGSAASVCAPGTVSICVLPAATYSTFSWSSSETTECITTGTAGTYTVTVTDANGCTQVLSTDITVNPSPTTAVISVSGNPILCATGSVTLNADTTGAGAGASIAWNDFDGSTGNSLFVDNSNFSFIFANPYSFSFTVTNAFGCSIVSNSVDVTSTGDPCGNPMQIDLVAYLQGYYIGAGTMQPVLANQAVAGATGLETDTITVEIYDENTFLLAGSTKAVLMTDGTCSAVVSGLDGNYYIAIRHRNSVLTWSAAPVALATATPASYDFSTDPIQSMSGMAADDLLEGIYSIFSGDINQDEFVDPNDYPYYDIDNSAGLCCDYITTDLNGDGFVDPNDYPYFDINNSAGIFSIHP
ncbi:MAG: hypothetical protein IPP51_00930 [Bacteroidetes bacterium]|nr:hypothetical protein [Bacteroidota bacterium]